MLLCIWSDKLRQPLIGCGADCGQSQPWLVKARSTNWCETKATPSVSHNSTQLGSDKTDSRRLQDIYDVWGHCRRNYAEWCKHKSEPWQHQFTHQEIPPLLAPTPQHCLFTGPADWELTVSQSCSSGERRETPLPVLLPCPASQYPWVVNI